MNKNREIKFRVWDTQSKCWLENWIGINNHGVVYVDSSHGSEDLNLHDAAVIQQYTGIKDKNGKEIYEGDVVQYKVKRTDVSKVTEQLEIKTITFSNGRFSPFPEKICYPDYTDYESYDFEVIGHIFEN